jgi:hypothetical protein
MMSIKLLGYFAANMSTDDFLSALTESSQSASALVCATRRCLAMPETLYGQVELLTEQLPFRCMGGDICGGVYTPLPPKGPDPPVSVAAHRLPAYLQIYVQEMQEDPSYTLAKDFPPIEAHKISTYVETATLREALLDFMLESMHHGRPSLTHHLMGLKECATTLQPTLVFPRDMRGYDETCLSAIMKQLGRDGLCWKV